MIYSRKKDNACKVDREMLHTRKMNLNTTKLESVSSVYECITEGPPYYFDFSQDSTNKTPACSCAMKRKHIYN